MTVTCYADDYTGYTENQQIEFRNRLNDQMLLVDAINGIRVPDHFPLLWVQVVRAAQLQPGYEPATDLVYILSNLPLPLPWRPILDELHQMWERQRQDGIRVEAEWWHQAQKGAQQLATGQAQMMSPYGYPQQYGMDGHAGPSFTPELGYGYNVQPPEDSDLEEVCAAAIRAAEEQAESERALDRVDSGVGMLNLDDESDPQTTTTGRAGMQPCDDLGSGLEDLLDEETARLLGLLAD
jgi:hypothetical protein